MRSFGTGRAVEVGVGVVAQPIISNAPTINIVRMLITLVVIVPTWQHLASCHFEQSREISYCFPLCHAITISGFIS